MELDSNEEQAIWSNQQIKEEQKHEEEAIGSAAVEFGGSDRSKYGNYIVLFECRSFVLTLGPDYCCFIPSFIGFILASYLLIGYVESIFQSQVVIYLTYIICILQCLSYLMVGLSNPRILLQQNNKIKKVTAENKHLFCHICGVQRTTKIYHCQRCDVCIDGYDHHCPWVSKCIGKGNIHYFNFFLVMTPIYILSFIFLMMTALALNVVPHTSSHLAPTN